MIIQRKSAWVALAILLAATLLQAADGTSCYWIYFRDKGLLGAEREQALLQAEQNLTPRARARREKNHVALADDYDIPVCVRYVEQVGASGVQIRTVSPWLNAVSVEATASQFAQIQRFSCVQRVEPFRLRKADMFPRMIPQRRALDFNYGPSYRQYELSHIPELHARGLSGRGVIICFLDTGCELTHRAFDSLHVLATYDFIHHDSTVQNVRGQDPPYEDSHGTGTLSICGGYRDSILVGPAYHSTYIIAKTEWVPTETHSEEDNYVAALHWADSLGTDITSSSLGYIGPDSSNLWYSFSQLDGHTATTTRGLEIAAAHGILCVTAAGNERNDFYFPNWRHIVTPADADSILAVGAVDSTGEIAGYSSPGPTGDGRIKPDVCAQGSWTFWAQPDSFGADDQYGYAFGTSLATPIVAGAAALIMEAHPTWTAQMVRRAIMETASMASDSNNDYGWGIMNAEAAADYVFSDVPGERGAVPRSSALLSTYPNPVNGSATLTLTLPSDGTGKLAIYDLLGRTAFDFSQTQWTAGEHHVSLNTENFTSGIYFARFEGNAGHAMQKMVILK